MDSSHFKQYGHEEILSMDIFQIELEHFFKNVVQELIAKCELKQGLKCSTRIDCQMGTKQGRKCSTSALV